MLTSIFYLIKKEQYLTNYIFRKEQMGWEWKELFLEKISLLGIPHVASIVWDSSQENCVTDDYQNGDAEKQHLPVFIFIPYTLYLESEEI